MNDTDSNLLFLIKSHNLVKSELVLSDAKYIECLKSLSRLSSLDIQLQLSNTTDLEKLSYILLDLALTVIQNLKKNFNLNIFKTNESKTENILMATRLLGTILNLSNNSVQFSLKLINKDTAINSLFQMICGFLNSLNENTTSNSRQLICFVQTGLDLIFAYAELSQRFRNSSETKKKLISLKLKLSSMHSFEMYLNKLKYFLIQFDSITHLDNIENQAILSGKFAHFIEFLKTIEPINFFRTQTAVNGLKFLNKYSKINPNSFETYLTSYLLELLALQTSRQKADEFNAGLIIQILLNYSKENSKFALQFQSIKDSVSLLFTCLKSMVEGLKLNTINLENLMLLIYFIGKCSYSHSVVWIDCKAVENLIEVLDHHESFNERVLDWTIQTIKVVHDYEALNCEPFSKTNIFEYLKEIQNDFNVLLRSIRFQDAFDYILKEIEFSNLEESRKILLIEFLIHFTKYASDALIQNDFKSIEDTVKLTAFLVDTLRIILKNINNSSLFNDQYQQKGLSILKDFLFNQIVQSNLSENKIDSFLYRFVCKEIFLVLNRIFAFTRNVSDIDWNSIDLVKSMINTSFKINDETVDQAFSIISYQFGYEIDDHTLDLNIGYNAKLEKINQLLNEFSLIEDISIVLEKRNYLNLILYLDTDYIIFEKCEQDLQTSFIKFSVDYFEYSLKILERFSLINQTFDKTTVYLAKALKYLKYLMRLNCNIANISNKFCSMFHKNTKNGILILFKLINSEIMSDCLLNEKLSPTLFKPVLINIFDSVLLTLHNLSRVAYKYRSNWEEYTKEPLLNLLEIGSKYKKVSDQLTSYMIIANIVSDEDVNDMKEGIKHILKSIVEKIEYLAQILESEQTICRIQLNLNENTDKRIKVIEYMGKWNFIELITPLFVFSKCDELKYLIYNDYNMKEILNQIIYNGNETEQEYAFKLLYQLCFDDRIAHDIFENKKLYDLIQKQSSKQKNCDGINFVLKNKILKTSTDVDLLQLGQNQFQSKTNVSESASKANEKKSNHIMISYNRESREFCLKLKAALERSGLKCWIDVENISGSSLDAMANAIENSACILVCMTEKYKESPNCRLEAEYVMQTNKPFVPLILQKAYKPNGWLGLILGSKIYVDTTKYEFEDVIRRVVKEIESLKIINHDIALPNNGDDNKVLNISKWSSSQVTQWLNEKKIHSAIINSLANSNGEILHKIYEMYSKMPQFVCERLIAESDSQLKLIHLAYFTLELEKLLE